MSERRSHRDCWRPGDRSPGFLLFIVAVTLLSMLLSTCANAAPTSDERAAYKVGIVSGAYYSYVRELLARLTRAGVQRDELARVFVAGCSGATVQAVAETVLLQEPLPKNEAEIVTQTWLVMDNACASLKVTGT